MIDGAPCPNRMPKLLLADDDALLCEVLARAFSHRGFAVTVASSEERAGELAREDPPDYAVVDLRLGEKSGLDVVPMLVALNGAMRIVVFSAYGNIATAIEAIKLGATYYLCKPATADDIIVAFGHHAGSRSPVPPERTMSIKRLEWEHLWRVLREHRGNISQAARAMSMHRRTLQRKLAKRPVRN
jgi:two-component system response regulator RegA